MRCSVRVPSDPDGDGGGDGGGSDGDHEDWGWKFDAWGEQQRVDRDADGQSGELDDQRGGDFGRNGSDHGESECDIVGE